MNTEPFVIERIYKAPISNVWAAITDVNKMADWYFKLADFKPVVGFEFEFTGGDGTKEFLHKCKVTAVVDGSKITHSWTYDGYEGYSEVTWELFPEGDGTRLKLTHTGLETFPNIPSFKRENFVAGWTHITGISLKEYLEK